LLICEAFPDSINTNEKAIANRSDSLDNGIKYDIKNSLLNCMSKPLPNWAISHEQWGSYNGAYSDQAVCINTLPPRQRDPHSLVYMPLYDSRSNDERDENSGSTHTGCEQQIINNCVRDIHECRNTSISDGPSYNHPVTHVFSPEEVSDLGGAGIRLPTTYYSYTKILTTATATINSPTPPSCDYYIDQGSGVPRDCSHWGPAQVSTMAKTQCVSVAGSVDASCAPDVVTIPVPSPLPPPAVDCQCTKRTWVTASCPTYNYTEILTYRHALSATATPADKVPQFSITPISNTSDSILARIKSYKFTDTDPNQDSSSFIIVDPRDFFDLRDYVAGGRYASGYNRFQNGLVLTYDTCPVLGLENGYGGICDPTGKAGCNLPIYGVGPQTNFTDAAGNSYSYNEYHIKWSGYVKKWAFITAEQYLDNIKDRKNVGGGNLYLDRNHINENPVLMLTRADDYCEFNERYPGRLKVNPPPSANDPKLPCIHYLQYQSDTAGNYSFTDLFSPAEEPPLSPPVSYTVKHNYNVGADGRPDPNSPVLGTGSDIDIGGDGSNTGFVSFLDVTTPTSVYNDLSKNIIGARALTNADYSGTTAIFDATGKRLSGPVNSNSPDHQQAPGEYLGVDSTTGAVDTTKGVGIRLESGTSVAVRMLHPVDIDIDSTPNDPTQPANLTTNPPREIPTTKCGDSMDSTAAVTTGTTACGTCTIVTLPPTESDIFIPTNSQEEFQSFVTAAGKNHNGVPRVTVRKCAGKYESYNDATIANPNGASFAPEGPNLNPNHSQTWLGKIDCDALTSRPACNQTKLITAQRYCQLENGLLGNCNDCLAANDPDKANYNFTDALVHGRMVNNPYSGNASKCYFAAACFNNQANGCPSASTITGHVFCLAPETKITMADGTEKEIIKIKAGEEVLAFDAKHSRGGVMKKSKVKATAITKKQPILGIEDLKITPLHKVVLASGRAVMAKEIKVGDKILRGNGTIMTVTKIKKDLPTITVYNLVLEDGSDGYIANGLRVLSYPLLKGLEQK
jgi:hypothetical protein